MRKRFRLWLDGWEREFKDGHIETFLEIWDRWWGKNPDYLT